MLLIKYFEQAHLMMRHCRIQWYQDIDVLLMVHEKDQISPRF